jgi:hypothetical protein
MGKLPRGLRNNNPGNIRIANNNWKGKVPVSENTDKSFEQFQDFEGIKGMVWGVRALTKLGWTYLKQNPDHTIKTFISKYAPNTENNTVAYAQAVAKFLGVTVDAKVKVIYGDAVKQYLFILAIIKHENGMLYDEKEVSDGVALGNR